MFTKKLTSILIAGAGLFMFSSANAAWVDCDAYAQANGIQPNGGCTVSTTYDQDNTNPPLVVNDEGGAFGFTDWTFISKDETGGNDGDVTIGMNAFSQIMAVFKDGAGTFLTAYLLVADSANTWTTPFDGKETSHISYYGRLGFDQDVSEPATLGLLGLGLLGFGLARRRRS